MKHKKYNKESLQETINDSLSIREVLLKLGLRATSGNYRVFYRFVKNNNVNTDNLVGRHKSITGVIRTQTSEYLTNSKPISSSKLKERLIRENIKENRCEICGLTEWQNKPLSCQLHHVDGDNCNNDINNLIMLCPNCHSQTETFSGRNKKKKTC